MKGFFRYDGPIFVVCSKITDILWLNILFIICCIPVVTIGASLASLNYVALKMARNEEGYITKSFFKAFKDNFVKSTIIWLIYLVIIFVLAGDIRILNNAELRAMLPGMTQYLMLIAGGIITLVAVMIFTYVFALLAQFENTVGNTIKNAFMMSVKHLPFTLLMILITALPFILIYVNIKLLIILLVSYALCAFANAYILNRIFSFYMPDNETDEEVLSEDKGGL